MAKENLKENPTTVEKSEVLEIAGKKYYTLYGLIKAGSWSERHIKEEISRKNLRAYKPGKELLFAFTEVEKWILKKVA